MIERVIDLYHDTAMLKSAVTFTTFHSFDKQHCIRKIFWSHLWCLFFLRFKFRKF